MFRRRLRDLLILAIAVVFISTHRDRGVRHDGDIGELAGVTSGADDRKGRHLGFDTYAYPGDEVMRAWRDAEVPYEWVGYYLPSAPCHKGTSWGGKRERLADMGWGVAVVYVGQQPWGEVSVPAAARAAVAAPKPKAKVVPKAVTKTTARRQPARKGAARATTSARKSGTKTATKTAARPTTRSTATTKQRAPAAQAASTKAAPTKSAPTKSAAATTCSRDFVTAERGRI